MRRPDRSLYAASCPTGAAESSTKKVSGSMGNVTSHSLPGLCRSAISSARSMLSACTITLKRAAPLLTWIETLIISSRLPRRSRQSLRINYTSRSSLSVVRLCRLWKISQTVAPGVLGAMRSWPLFGYLPRVDELDDFNSLKRSRKVVSEEPHKVPAPGDKAADSRSHPPGM